MNTVVTTDKAAEKRAKNAERARQRRAAAKAAKVTTEPVGSPSVEAPEDRKDNTDPQYALVIIDGETYKVDPSQSAGMQQKVAKALHAAYLARQNGNANAPTPDVDRPAPQDAPKAPKAVKLKGDPLATVPYRISKTAMEALSGKLGAEYRKANPKAWKVLAASKKITGGQSFAFTGSLRPDDASVLAATLRGIAASEGFKGAGSLLTNAAKLESNHYAK